MELVDTAQPENQPNLEVWPRTPQRLSISSFPLTRSGTEPPSIPSHLPFTSIQPIAPALLVWSLCYCIVLPLVGFWRFQRRDL